MCQCKLCNLIDLSYSVAQKNLLVTLTIKFTLLNCYCILQVGEDEDDNEINDNNEDISDTEENYNDDFNESKSHRTADSDEEEEDRKEDSHKTADDDREDGDDRDGRNVKMENEENNESVRDSPDKAKSEDKVVVEPKKRKVITPIKMEPEKPKKPTTPIKFESKVTIKSELTENSIYIDPSKPVG